MKRFFSLERWGKSLPWLKIFLLAKLLFLVVFAILVIIPLRFHMYYQKQEENDDFVIEVEPPKKIFYHKIVIPVVKIKDHWRKIVFEWEGELGNEQEVFLQGKEHINILEEYRLILGTMQRINEHTISCGYLARYIKLQKLKLILQVGTGNPAYTGIITGLLWGTVTSISARILKNIRHLEEKPIIEIAPDFTKKNFAICLDSIFTLTIGHIITISGCILINELKRYLRKRKLGKKEVTDNG